MSKKTLGIILVVAGFLLAIVSLIGDMLWSGSTEGIGPFQIGGAAVGLVAAVAGVLLMTGKAAKKKG